MNKVLLLLPNSKETQGPLKKHTPKYPTRSHEENSLKNLYEKSARKIQSIFITSTKCIQEMQRHHTHCKVPLMDYIRDTDKRQNCIHHENRHV